ncbi:nickel ABC transporter substrate-binding protein [Carnobacteriaceae bacterium zg-C25]|nr:nickel ABC transporter substrate-binding protein [Carnobacteriaceae bacterium zg-C25]
MKKITRLLASLFAVIVLASCGSGANQVSDKTKLTFASTKDIRDINPHLYAGEMAAQNMIFEGLVINTKDGVKPHLATKWDISEDGLTYTFDLREDVSFSDGEKFNAHAAKANFDALLNNRKRHAWIETANNIDTVTVKDDYTLVLTIKTPYYPTLEELGMTRPFRFISPKSMKDGNTKDGVSSFVGTGPYVLSEHVANQYSTFTANENYWGDKPKLKTITWKVLPDEQAMLLALQNGEVDLLFGADGDAIDINAYKQLEAKGEYMTTISDPIASRALILNTQNEHLSNATIRLALQHAVDKKSIADGVLNGTENPANALFANTIPYANVSLEGHVFDLSKAQSLIESQGYSKNAEGYMQKDGKVLQLTLSYNNQNAQEKTIGEYIQADFKKIGVKLNLLGEEKQAFFDRQKTGEFDMQYLLSWGVPYDPQTSISSWRVPAHADYQAQLGLDKKAWLDETISRVMAEQDDAKRQALYKDILTYIHEQNVYVPMTYSRTKAVYKPILKGVGFNLSQYEIPFEKMYFE